MEEKRDKRLQQIGEKAPNGISSQYGMAKN